MACRSEGIWSKPGRRRDYFYGDFCWNGDFQLVQQQAFKALRRGKGNGGKRADDRSGFAGLQLCTRFCFYDSFGDPSGPRCRRGGLGPERIRGGAL